MLWIKVFHLFAVIAWFAGIFYMPRLFVYYALERQADYWVAPGSEAIIPAVPLFQNIWQHVGKEEFDQQIRDAFELDSIFPLRSEVLQTRTSKKGETSSTKIVQFIKILREVEDPPGGTFDIPDCDQVGAKKMEKKFKALLKDLLS